jgi:hypothetical protein
VTALRWRRRTTLASPIDRTKRADSVRGRSAIEMTGEKSDASTPAQSLPECRDDTGTPWLEAVVQRGKTRRAIVEVLTVATTRIQPNKDRRESGRVCARSRSHDI